MKNKKSLIDLQRQVIVVDRGCKKTTEAWFSRLSEEVEMEKVIIGIDEVGRGCVYGPLVVAATANLTGWRLSGIRDSKKIKSEKTRQTLADEIVHNLVNALAWVPAHAIDQFGIDTAVITAGHRVRDIVIQSVRKIAPNVPIEVIFDGDDHPDETKDGVTIKSIVKADDTVFEVSAASILAKVARDNWVHDQVARNPKLGQYRLDDNKGYGTEHHAQAIERFGLTEHHRQKFCRSLLANRAAKALEESQRNQCTSHSPSNRLPVPTIKI